MHATRRHALGLGAATLALAAQAPSHVCAQADNARFEAFLQSLWPKAQAQRVSRATFDTAIKGLTLDPSLIGSGERQAEFERTIKAYMDDAASGGRVSTGATAYKRYRSALDRVEQMQKQAGQAYGVPAEMIVAIWGMETDFGRSTGDRDVVRSLATQAFSRTDGPKFSDEVVAAMVMMEAGVERAKLKGSWAGAMGHPQFLPSAYLKYAVSFAGARAPDIWSSIEDALASIGNFIHKEGWKAGLAWGCEVIVPASFDWKSLKGTAASLAAIGIKSADGRPLPTANAATLFFPAGATGPAFLLTENYWIIKQYNNSDSYAMSVAHLGDRIAGRPALRAPWPKDFRLLAREERVKLQTLLRDQGFYTDKIDGRFGPASRDAIHKFQVSAGMTPADGFASTRVLSRLEARR